MAHIQHSEQKDGRVQNTTIVGTEKVPVRVQMTGDMSRQCLAHYDHTQQWQIMAHEREVSTRGEENTRPHLAGKARSQEKTQFCRSSFSSPVEKSRAVLMVKLSAP